MAIINLNGVALPPPTKYDVTSSTIDGANSGRNESGIMTREVVRRGVANISISWDKLTETELELIINQADMDSIEVTYFWGKWRTATMYSDDIKTSMVAYPDESYWTASFNLVEY